MSTIEKGHVFEIASSIDYSANSVVSREILKNTAGTMTIFAFDKGQGLSEHSAPFDASVYVTDGVASVFIDGKKHEVKKGEMIIMPAKIPHALQAEERFKMLLIMIKGQ